MEQKWPNAVFIRASFIGFTIFVALVTKPTLAVDIYADPEMIVQNGTTGILRCTFKSHEVVSSSTTVSWSFQPNDPNNKLSSPPNVIYYYSGGKGFPGVPEFRERVQFVGDINKKDVSIQLGPVQFSDNGTFFCDVRNPPDVTGTVARIELRVVRREALPQTNATLIIGAVCGALGVLVLVALTACFVLRHRTRHDYEGAR